MAPKDSGSQTVDRALTVLALFTLETPAWTLTEVSQRLGLSLSTTHRVLKSLLANEFLVMDEPDKRYTLGPNVMRLARVLLDRDDVVQIHDAAARHLSNLRNATGETVGLHRRLGGYRTCVAELVSFHAVRTQTSVGGVQPLHAGAASHALIAWMRPAELDQLFPSDTLPGITDRTIRTRAALDAELARVREAGYAITFGESVAGSAGIAAPIFGPRGEVVAAINIAGPSDRWNHDAMLQHVEALLDSAESISRQLGYRSAATIR